MISCSAVEITSVTSKPGKEKGSKCNEKLLMKTYVLSAFLYEYVGQRLSTPSAGEPFYQVRNNIFFSVYRVHGTFKGCFPARYSR